MQAFSLARADDAAGAIAQARQPGAKFIAGGTDLMQLMKERVEAPTALVDVDRLPLAEIVVDAGGLRLGALARMSDVAAHPEVAREYPVVAQSLLASASPQLRNMASIGGNLMQRTRCGYFRDVGFAACNKRAPGSGCAALRGHNRMHAILGGSEHCIATHPSDLAVALLALDATVDLQGPDGARTVKLADFHLLPGDTPQHETALRAGELILRVNVPASGAARNSRYLKLRDRASFEFALVSAAVAVEAQDGVIRQARVALGGVGAKPWRAVGVEAALAGQPMNGASFQRAALLATEGAKPASDNGFKQVLAQRAVVRALADVA